MDSKKRVLKNHPNTNILCDIIKIEEIEVVNGF